MSFLWPPCILKNNSKQWKRLDFESNNATYSLKLLSFRIFVHCADISYASPYDQSQGRMEGNQKSTRFEELISRKNGYNNNSQKRSSANHRRKELPIYCVFCKNNGKILKVFEYLFPATNVWIYQFMMFAKRIKIRKYPSFFPENLLTVLQDFDD